MLKMNRLVCFSISFVLFISSLQTVTHADDETITIATFNIQIFGRTKAKKPGVLKKLSEIVRQYDIVAIQEFKDSKQETPIKFLEEINSLDDTTYGLILGQRVGLQSDDKKSQEQYAYYYNTKKIIPYGKTLTFPDTANDRFQREPLLARFKTIGGKFTFVLINIHTRPTRAVEEIGALHEVNQWARSKYLGEKDFITLGDFNASGSYGPTEELDELEFRSEGYNWIVGDDADTNLAKSDRAYDRIVISDEAFDDYAGKMGVDSELFDDKKISDHWPVWAKFYIARDSD